MKRNISPETIKIIIENFFKKVGVSKKNYQYVIDSLVETSLRGLDSHGIRLVPHYVKAVVLGRINKNPKFSFKKTSPTSGIFDADHGYGITAGVLAMDKAIALAQEFGIGAVVVKNSSHFGATATFGLRAARKDMLGLAFTNTESLVFPYGGKRTYLGTNPICFTAPVANEEPFCLDMATSQIPRNKILLLQTEKKKLEPGWAADDGGNPCVDPKKVAGLLPTGLYKGYGLGLMIEILCSLLSGMPFGKHVTPMYPLNGNKRRLGHFFMAIDIARFENIKVFKRRLKQLLDELRQIPPVAKGGKVLVAGDPEKITLKKRLREGIPLTLEIVTNYESLAKELGIKINWNVNR